MNLIGEEIRAHLIRMGLLTPAHVVAARPPSKFWHDGPTLRLLGNERLDEHVPYIRSEPRGWRPTWKYAGSDA